MSSPRIGIVGTGNVGGNLGVRLSQAGLEVRFATRAGTAPPELLSRTDNRAQAGTLTSVGAWADVFFLAVPAPAAVDAARGLGELSGKVLVDCTNPLKWDQGPVWAPPAEGSVTAALAKAVPSAKVVKAFNTFGAELHADPAVAGTVADVYIAGDDAGARATVADIARRAGFEPVDCGPLRNAAVLENVAILWIHLALAGGQGRNIVFKLLRR